jgi:diguanylate cyclase (GGDEF)-like protein
MNTEKSGGILHRDVDDLILAGQVKFLYQQLRPALYASLAVATLLVVTLWTLLPPISLLIWFFLLASVTVARFVLQTKYMRCQPEPREIKRWRYYFLLGSLCAGFVWSAAPYMLMPPASLGHQMLVLFILGGVMVAATQSLSATITPFVVFSLPIMISSASWLFQQHTPIHLSMGFLMIFFSIALLFFSRYFNKTLTELLNLRSEENELIEQLQREVEQRKHTEAEMVRHNRILEMLAKQEPLETILDAINRTIEELCPDALSSILLLDDSGKHLLATSAPSLPKAFSQAIHGVAIGPKAGSCGTAVHRNEMVIVEDIAHDPLWSDYRDLALEHGLRACWSMPIRDGQGTILGTFALYHREPCRPDDAEIELIQATANFAGIAIERKRAEDKLQRLAHEDALTSLPNRALLMDRLEQSIAQAKRLGQQFALLFVDLDHFKTINDTLGHEAGDRVLVEVARRLKKCVREMDTVSRLGGDEFMIILTDVHETRDVVKVAEKILKNLSQPFDLNGNEYFIGGSIGISLYPADGTDVDTLIRHADAAMYRAKDEGREGYQFYTTDIGIRVRERLKVEKNLQRAIRNGEFILHYQPIIDLQSGHIDALEALIRWQHPKKGLLTASQFMPLAEKTNLILPIGELALRKACFQHKAWQDAGLADFHVCVNLTVNISALQLRKKNLPKIVASILRESGLDPGQLELELTENATREPSRENIAILGELKDLGVRISIDDFGTGVSSLNYLKHFPIDAIKIDRSLIQKLPGAQEDMGIVKAVIDMAHSMNIKVIAEGVETPEQFASLRQFGFDEAQGYLFSHPLSPEDAGAFLRKYKNHSFLTALSWLAVLFPSRG